MFYFMFFFWIAVMGLAWYAQKAAFRLEVGAEKAAQVQREKNWFQKLFYLGYSQYVHKHRLAFFTLKSKFIVMLLMLAVYPLAGSRSLEVTTNIYMAAVMVSFLVDGLALVCFEAELKQRDGLNLDASGDYIIIEADRVRLKLTWDNYQEEKKHWEAVKTSPKQKKRLRAIRRMETACWLAEKAIRDYYSYVDVLESEEKRQQREADIQRLQAQYCELQELFCAEGRKDYDVFRYSRLLYAIEPFERRCRVCRQKMQQAKPKKKKALMEQLFREAAVFCDGIADRYVEHQKIGRADCFDCEEAVAAVLAVYDEVEAWMETIPHPGLESCMAYNYGAMYGNGLLPEERENRFPDMLPRGEGHIIYAYDCL